jgi:DNA-binding SARP family transcriptional activator
MAQTCTKYGRRSVPAFFRSLGSLEVVDNGETLPTGTPRTRTVLAILLARRGGLVGVDQLVDELWPDNPGADPRMLVHGYVSRLRRSLGPVASQIVTRKPGYLLQVGEQDWDVHLFEQSIMDARAARASGQLDRCIKLLSEAQAQWTGEPFADVPPTAAITAAATALGELRRAGLEEWFEARQAAGGDPELITDLSHQVAAHPLREPLVARLMLALRRSGRRADALSIFRLTRDRLNTELGVEPGADLQRLHQQVLQDVDHPAVTAGEVPAQLPMGVLGFVGRQRELTALTEADGVATITGTAGVGKTKS